MERREISRVVSTFIGEIAELDAAQLSDDTPLIGPQAIVKSRMLVELMLALEEFADERMGVEFDWSSDSAWSTSRSMFRTIGTLVDHLYQLGGKTG